MFDTNLLSGKTILVTGGGTGLGRAMALRFAELGARLAVLGRRPEPLNEVVQAIEAQGGEAIAVTADVRDAARVNAAVDDVLSRFGTINVLVNNAAGNFLALAETLSPNAFNAVVGIVLNGTFHCTAAVGKHLIAQGTGGCVLNIVATYAWTGAAYVVPSVCAKAGVLAMTRSLAVEWGRYRIRLNAIAPGPFPTEGAWSRLMLPGMEEEGKRRNPTGRFGEPAELANLAAYLVSDAASYINGECITMDGGEWLMGQSFNLLTQLPPDQFRALSEALRPKKSATAQ
ncbi:MAG: SDR family oxidoreductase [Chloracidobacterium sp.]